MEEYWKLPLDILKAPSHCQIHTARLLVSTHNEEMWDGSYMMGYTGTASWLIVQLHWKFKLTIQIAIDTLIPLQHFKAGY